MRHSQCSRKFDASQSLMLTRAWLRAGHHLQRAAAKEKLEEYRQPVRRREDAVLPVAGVCAAPLPADAAVRHGRDRRRPGCASRDQNPSHDPAAVHGTAARNLPHMFARTRRRSQNALFGNRECCPPGGAMQAPACTLSNVTHKTL